LGHIFFLMLGLASLNPIDAFGSVTITSATNGLNIPADSAANAPFPAWRTLGAITIDEASNANKNDFGVGTGVTLVLKAPTGFEFNTAVTPNITFTSNRDISSASIVVNDSTTITITLTVTDTRAVDRLTIGNTTGIQVRPTLGAPLASGNIFRPTTGGGSASISGITATSNANGSGGTSFGALSEVAGVVAKLAFTTQPGSATEGLAFGVQPVIRTHDQFGNNSTTGLAAHLNVTVALTSGTGNLLGNSILDIGAAAGNGTAAYTDLGIDAPGTNKQLTASATGLTSALSSVFTVSLRPADLAVSMTDTPDPLNVGSNLVYNITLTNQGPGAAFAVVLTNTLPAGVSFVSATLSQGSCTNSGGVVACNLGTMTNRARATISIQVTTLTAGALTNQAVVSAISSDLNLTNNTATVVTIVNAAPTLSDIPDQMTNEDTATGAIGFTVGDAETAAGALSLSATSSNTNLVPQANLLLGGSGSNLTVTVTPAPDQFGTTLITITVNDGMATASDSFLLTVNSVNDPPTLNPLSNVTTNEDAGLQTVSFGGISSGATNENQTFMVTAVSSDPALIPNPTVNYTSPNGGGTLTFTPLANANGTATITVTVQDDGGTLNGGQNSFSRDFQVTINPVNDRPTLDAISDVTINEDSGTTSVNLTGISSGRSNEIQGLVVTATSSNPALIPDPDVTYASPNTTGTLSFTPVSNANGTVTITVTVQDNGGTLRGGQDTFTRTFVVVVNPVNDPPTLNALSDMTVNEDSGSATVNLTGLTPDPSDGAQTLSVLATSSNPALIPNPSVTYTSPNSSGTLTFTPLTNANGTATITVTVQDDGGTMHGGQDTFSRTFVVTVNPVNDPPTLNPLSNLLLDVNAGLQTVPLSGITFGPANENQINTVSAVSSNPALIPDPAVSYTSPNSGGTLTFSSVSDATGEATITVNVQDDGGTLNGGQNNVSQQFTVTVVPVADLAISQVATPNPVIVASNLTVTLSITNRGPSPAMGVLVTNTLPASFNFISASASQGSCSNNAGVIICNLGNLPRQTAATVSILVVPTVQGNFTNTASVASNTADRNQANNRSSLAITAVGVPYLIPAATTLTAENCSNGAVDPAETVTMTFALKNNGSGDSTNLVATLLAAGGVTSPSGPQTYGRVVAGGPATNRPFTFTASSVCGETVIATLQLQDGGANLGMVTFHIPLGLIVSNRMTFARTNFITIPTLGAATPYPSTNISTLTGTVSKVTVTISNFNHTFPDDVDILLVAPSGQAVLLMSDTGLSLRATNVTLTFDDEAAAALPDSGGLFSGTYRPTDFETADTFPFPAPGGPYATNLSVFNGTAANGPWRLFVYDDTAGDIGSIAGGWSLTLSTKDPACCIGSGTVDLVLGLSGSPNPVVTGNDLTYALSLTNRGRASATSVLVTNRLPVGVPVVSAISSQGSCSQNSGTVVCNLGTLASNAVATMTIKVHPLVPGILTNIATVTSSQPDYNPPNNTSIAVTTANYPTLAILDATAVAEGNSGITEAVFSVALTAASSQTITVNYATADDTAAAGSDYFSTNGVLTYAPGETLQMVTVMVNGDVFNEATEFFTVNLSSPVNAALGVGQSPGAIMDDDPLPGLSINDVSLSEGDSGGTNAIFVVTLSPASGQQVTVNFATANSTALAPVDYAATSGTIVFDPGETTKTIFVPIVGDRANEVNETFLVNLSSEVNANIDDGQATGSILNDDLLATIAIVAASVSAENCSPGNGRIDPNETVTVSFSLRNVGTGTANASNLVATLRAVGGVVSPSSPQNYGTLTVGGPAVSRSFTFSASGNCGDTLRAVLQLQSGPNDLGFVTNSFLLGAFSSRTNIFANSSPIAIPGSGSAEPYPSTITVSGITGAVTKVTVTLTNIDHTYPADMDVLLVGPMGQMVMLISDAGIAGGIGGVTLKFDDAASNFLPEFDQIVSGTYKPSDYDAEDSFDPPAPPGPYDNPLLSVFNGVDPNGAWSLYVFDDVDGDGGSLGWSITIARQADPICCGVNSLADLAVFKVDAPDPITIGGNLTYTLTLTNRGPSAASGVVLSDTLPANLSFVSATSSLGSCTNSGGTITCELGAMTNTSRATITIVATTIVAGRITNSASVVSATSDPNLTNNTGTAVTTIIPIVSIASTDPTASETGQAPGVFTVSRMGGTVGSLTVNYTTAGTATSESDFTALSGSVTIPNGAASAPVTITPVDDFLLEFSESVVLTLSTNASYTINAASNTAMVTILDNDVLGLVLSTNALVVTEGGSNSVTVRLSAQPTNTVIVTTAFTSGDTDLSVNAGASLTFNSNDWNVAQTVRLRAAEDNDAIEGQAMFTLSSPGLTSQILTATEAENDVVAIVVSTNRITVPEGGTNVFTIQLAAQPTNTVTVTTTRTDGDTDLSVDAGATRLFTTDNWNVAQAVIIQAAMDVDADHGQGTFTITSPGLTDRTLTAIEADNDLLQLDVSTNHLAVPEGGTNDFTVRLTAQPTNNLTITVSRASGGDSDLTVSAGSSLVFTPTNWNLLQTVSISASSDEDVANGQADFILSGGDMTNQIVTAIEADTNVLTLLVSTMEDLRITGIRRTGADAMVSFLTVAGSSYRVEHTDNLGAISWTTVADDVAGNGHTVEVTDVGGGNQPVRFYRVRLLSSAGAGMVTVLEGGTNTFSVRLSAQPATDLTVNISRAGGSDTNLNVVSGAALTFNMTDWNIPQTVAISDSEDDDAENGLATFTVSATGLSNQTVIAIEADNDVQFLTLSTSLLIVPEDTNRVFTVRLNAQPLTNVTVTTAFSAGSTNLRVAAGALLTFDSTDWNIPQPVAISASGDNDTTDDQATFTVASPGLPGLTLNVIAPDNDLQNLVRCSGEDALFGTSPAGSGPFTFVWLKSGNMLAGETNSSLLLTNVTAISAGTYTVEVSDGVDTVTKTGTLSVNISMTATGPASQTICAGDAASLSVSASGSGPVSYQWSKDGTNVVGATNSSLLLTDLGTADAGSYCVVVEGACDSLTNCAILTVLSRTTSSALEDQSVCPDSIATFSTTPSGSGPFSFQWTREGTNLVGQTNSSLVLTNVQEAEEGTYCVIVNGVCNSLTNCARLMLLNPLHPQCAPAAPAQSAEGKGLPILSLELEGADVVLRFATDPERKYRVEYKDDLSEGPWRTAVDNTTGNGSAVEVRHMNGAGRQRRFYRVILLP